MYSGVIYGSPNVCQPQANCAPLAYLCVLMSISFLCRGAESVLFCCRAGNGRATYLQPVLVAGVVQRAVVVQVVKAEVRNKSNTPTCGACSSPHAVCNFLM